MKLKRIQSRAIYLIFIIVIFIILSRTYLDQEKDITEIISTITAIIGVMAIWYEMKRSKDLAEAEFIIGLNQSFVENDQINKIYFKLESVKETGESIFTKDDIPHIVKYLTFFETINSLIDRGVVKIPMIDNLFAYRFYLIVHNLEIQEVELIKDAKYYKNIYSLHYKWTKYRKRRNLEILNEDQSLKKMNKDYRKYLR